METSKVKRKQLPSWERLNELFYYDNGKLIRNITVKGNARQGDVAGCLDAGTGYLMTRVDGFQYVNHRLIYKLIHKIEP